MIRLGIGVFLIVLPFLELILLVKLTHAIGFLWTLTLMLASAAAGGMVLAQQSAGSFRQALEAANRGEPPKGTVLEGAFLMLAGVLLIIPGLITDAIALPLLVPPLRHWLAHRAMAALVRAASRPDPHAERQRGAAGGREGAPFGAGRQQPGEGPIIEGEFQRLDEQPPRQEEGRNRP